MLPPYRQVRFNADLQHQDSFLLTSIHKIYNISPADAEKKLGMWLTEFSQGLEDCGSIDFGSIGTFTDDDEQLTFTPAEAGITTPEFYALDAFHIQEIPAEEKPVSSPLMETKQGNIIIRINRQIASYVAAACVAILLYVSFSTPAENTEIIGYNQSIASELFLPSNLLLPSSKHKASDLSCNNKHNSPLLNATIAEVSDNLDSPENNDIDCPEENYYCVVVASAVSQKNAERYVEILKQRGQKSARILNNGRITRVVVGKFLTEEEATDAARKIHRQSDEYKYAWVYKP